MEKIPIYMIKEILRLRKIKIQIKIAEKQLIAGNINI